MPELENSVTREQQRENVIPEAGDIHAGSKGIPTDLSFIVVFDFQM